jgi:hypothetical protein
MRRKNKIICTTCLIFINLSAVILSGCHSSTTQKPIQKISTQNLNQLQKFTSNNDNIISISKDSINYNMYKRNSIDLFLIAVALHNDFNNNYVLPNADTRQLYIKAKAYFMPYKNHPFIKELSKYMNGDDVNGDYLGILLCNTDLPKLNQQYGYGKYKLKDEDIKEFLKGLKNFYTDTKAENFFKTSDVSYDNLKKYIDENYDKNEIVNLIGDVVKYTNNKEKYYQNNNINYNTVLTLYRSKGSFFIVNENGQINFMSLQYGFSYTKSTNDNFNIDNIVKTSIHEYLHNFVNEPVANNMSLIEQLSDGKNKSDYASKIYENFPWNRVTDECFVRAIEARIFKSRFGEEKALKSIIYPETSAGFKQLGKVYNKLQQYEDHRDEYKSIDDFIPILIREMYGNN